MMPKLIISFRPYTEEEFLAKVEFIVARLTGHAGFPQPWAPQVPTLGQLVDAHRDYRNKYIDSATRDMLKIRARREARAVVADMLQRIAAYLELVAQGDMALLESTGFDLRGDVTRVGNTQPLDPPAELRLSHGRSSGTVAVRIGRLRGARSYEVAVASGESGAPGEWTHATSSTSGQRIVLPGLQPGRDVWVRAREVGSAGPGLWTEPMRLMVV